MRSIVKLMARVCCSMIVILLASLVFYTTGYYVALAWMSLSIAFFLVRPFLLFRSYHKPQL